MKKIFFACIGLMMLLQACYEDYKNDYAYTTTYFAMQAPLRSLLIEEDGKALRMEVGVVLAGKYANEATEIVAFEVDATMLDEIDELELLPETYYELSDDKQFVISSGKTLGTINVTFNDNFLNDPKAASVNYALPLRIVSSTTDSIHSTMDSTIIAVRYLNKYHGAYYIKGAVMYKSEFSGLDTTFNYNNSVLINNIHKEFRTVNTNSSDVGYVGADKENNSMRLTFTDKTITIAGVDGNSVTNLTGSGKLEQSTEDRFKVYTANQTESVDLMVLNYNYELAGTTYTAIDTLVKFHVPMKLETWP